MTVGKVALPEMQARGYSPAFSTGVCAAGGSLGALLPPASGVIILFALLSAGLDRPALRRGDRPGPPGLRALSRHHRDLCARVAAIGAGARGRRSRASSGPRCARCGPAALLFGSVLGGVYFGFFTVTEAAAVGAFESFLCALLRGKLRGKNSGT